MPHNAPQTIIAACAGRSADARDFLLAFHRLVHALDDVADAAPGMTAEGWAMPLREFIEVCLMNPFCRDYNRELATLISHSVSAWLDSNRWKERDDPRARQAADVLKSLYHEVFWFTACKANDWHYMRKMQELYREFDFED